MSYPHWLTLALCAVAIGGCAEPAATTATVTGNLEYRERIMLGPEAVATVTLEDVSLADAPAKIIAQQEIVNPGPPPIAYSLEFPVAAIDPSMTYSVRAQIHDRGRLVFTSDTHAPVLTRGAGATVDLLLINTMRPPIVSPPEPAAEQPGEAGLAGMFRYMADAPLFRDCRTNRVYPVAMEGAYIELERAYLNSGIEGGGELMVNLDGRFLERPAMEGDHNEINLIVDSFTAIYPEQSCEPTVDEALLGTYWKLTEVNGRPVVTPEGQREAHMVLEAAQSRVRGHAGCNNFFGGYVVDGQGLSFGALGSTMMACPAGMDTESAFLGALEAADRFEISGQTMTLLGKDAVLARFEAVYF